jgi:hypothetical protein
MVEYMGKTFGTAEAIIYLNGTYQMEDIVSKELSVDYFEKQAYMFLIALWIIRDHTISLLRSLFKRSLVDSHADYTYYPYGQRYFDSAGRSLKQTEYTLEDIRVAGEYYHDYLPHLNTASYEATSHTVTFVPTEFDNTSTRLSRFVHLLNHARTIYDIGLKLALFCSCLECLFSNKGDKQDVTLRVAQRTALFLEAIPCKRRSVFKDVKDAYSLRSNVLHGGKIDKKLPELERVCVQTDSVLRKVFAMILNSRSSTVDYFKLFTTDDTQLQEHLDHLVFDTRPYSGTVDNLNWLPNT